MRVALILLAATTALSVAGLAVGAATRARLSLEPTVVLRGNPVAISGRGFAPNVKVTIRIGRPHAAVTSPFGTVTAGPKGGFDVTRKISNTTPLGKWIVRACQQGCRVKATALLHVGKIKPV